VHRFDPARFEVAISRFGTMFFSDPAEHRFRSSSASRPGSARTSISVILSPRTVKPATENGRPPRQCLERDLPAVGLDHHPPGGRAERTGRQRRSGQQPRRPLHDRVRRSVAGRRPPTTSTWPGYERRGRGSGPTPRGGTTSTSRPPTRTRSVSGRPTAQTSTASSKPNRHTTRRTCSAGTGTSGLEPDPGRQGRCNRLAVPVDRHAPAALSAPSRPSRGSRSTKASSAARVAT
jgi:hypothetical protein